MSNENWIQTPQPAVSNESTKSGNPGDSVRMKEWLREAQSDAERARVQSEQTREHVNGLREELNAHGRSARRAGWSSALLWIALLGVGAYGYWALHGQSSLQRQVPGLQESLSGLAQRVGATEEQLRAWSSNWETMTARLNNVESDVSNNLRAAKAFAQEQTAKVQQQVLGEMNNRTRAVEARLAQAETAQQQDRAQLASLRQEVGTLRSESGQQLAHAQQENGREFGNLRREINQNRDDFDTMARHQERWRADFEVSKQQGREVAPGLALTVLKTDVSRQQVDGWLHLMPDGKILWLRQHGINQPMQFRNQRDDQLYEMVFTRISKDGAVGYVLSPRYPSSQATESSGAAALQDRAAVQ